MLRRLLKAPLPTMCWATCSIIGPTTEINDSTRGRTSGNGCEELLLMPRDPIGAWHLRHLRLAGPTETAHTPCPRAGVIEQPTGD